MTTAKADPPRTLLQEAELGIIDLFVHAAQALGLPKSVRERYGLLYGASAPMSFEDIMRRLRISKGSTSQGLRFLRNLRAVKTVYLAGQRRDYSVAEKHLRDLSRDFIRERILPHLENGRSRLDHLESLVGELPGRRAEELGPEVERLRIWNEKSREALSPSRPVPGFRWLHQPVGTNRWLTEMQSALGRLALVKLPDRVARCRRHAEILTERLSALSGLTVPRPPEHVHRIFYRFYTYALPKRLRSGWNRDRILATLDQRGFPAFSGPYCEVYREGVFRDAGLGPRARRPNTQWLSENSLMFDVHHRLRQTDLMRVADAEEDVIKETAA